MGRISLDDNGRKMIFPNDVKEIVGASFPSEQMKKIITQITNIELPEELVSVGKYAFKGYCLLECITLPNSVTNIDCSAFEGCESIESIELPEKLESIGMNAFKGCKNLKRIVVPETCKTIGSSAFFGCESLECIELPEKLESIGDFAFKRCKNLRSIVVPETCKTIGDAAFAGCCNLDTIIFSGNNSSFTSKDGQIYSADGTELIRAYSKDSNYIISSTVRKILPQAFCECENLQRIELPEGVIEIGDAAFCDCINLKEISLPEKATSLGAAAFRGCESLIKVELSKELTSILKNTFQYCGALTEIKLPEKIVTVEDGAFNRCNELGKITIENPGCRLGLIFETYEVWKAFPKLLINDEFANLLIHFDGNVIEDTIKHMPEIWGNFSSSDKAVVLLNCQRKKLWECIANYENKNGIEGIAKEIIVQMSSNATTYQRKSIKQFVDAFSESLAEETVCSLNDIWNTKEEKKKSEKKEKDKLKKEAAAKEAYEKLSPIEKYCADHFDLAEVERLVFNYTFKDETIEQRLSNILYKQSSEIVPRLAVECAIAQYIKKCTKEKDLDCKDADWLISQFDISSMNQNIIEEEMSKLIGVCEKRSYTIQNTRFEDMAVFYGKYANAGQLQIIELFILGKNNYFDTYPSDSTKSRWRSVVKQYNDAKKDNVFISGAIGDIKENKTPLDVFKRSISLLNAADYGNEYNYYIVESGTISGDKNNQVLDKIDEAKSFVTENGLDYGLDVLDIIIENGFVRCDGKADKETVVAVAIAYKYYIDNSATCDFEFARDKWEYRGDYEGKYTIGYIISNECPEGNVRVYK